MSSNPFSNVLTTEIKTLFKQAIQEVVRGTSVTCRVFYQSISEICPNCIFNAIVGKSANIYKAGGPYPFPNGQVCPFCHGVGKIEREPTDDIDLCVIRNKAQWIHIGGSNVVRGPDTVQTISGLDTLIPISRAKEIIFNVDVEGYFHQRWERDSIPDTVGLGEEAFIIVFWRLKSGQ